MKKTILLIISIVLILSIGIPLCSAADVSTEWYGILNKHITEDELVTLNNAELYNGTMEGIVIGDKPIVKVYNNVPWETAHLPLADIVQNTYEQAEHRNGVFDYFILSDEIVRVQIYQNDGAVIVCRSPRRPTAYATDISNMSTDMEISGIQCRINDIYCFDGFSSMAGALVYLVTDKGVYVRYYESSASEGSIWYTEEEFRKYAEAYYEYISSYEHNYDEDGNALNGVITHFSTYVTDIYGKVEGNHPPLQTSRRDESETDTSYEQDKPSDTVVSPKLKPAQVIAIAVTSIAVLGIVTVLIFLVTKRKKGI